jgi:hypothetical protein
LLDDLLLARWVVVFGIERIAGHGGSSGHERERETADERAGNDMAGPPPTEIE